MRWKVHVHAVAILVAAAALAVGCGGDDEPAGGGGASGGEAQQTTKLAVQETAGVPSAFMAFGIAKGFFKDQGLDVKLETAQGGAATVPALVSGKIQIGGSNVVSLLIAASRGLPIQAIAPGTSSHDRGDKDFGAIMVPPGQSIRDVEDLRGKTVGVNTLNNIAEVVVRASLEKSGVDTESVKLAEVDFPEMPAALEKRDIDAAFAIEPFVTAAREQGAKVVDYSYVTTEPNMQVGAFAASRKFVHDNPQAIERFRAAVADTARYVMGHQSEFRTFLSQRANTPPALAKAMVLPVWNTELNTDSMQRTARLMQRFGMVKEPVDVGALTGGGGS